MTQMPENKNECKQHWNKGGEKNRSQTLWPRYLISGSWKHKFWSWFWIFCVLLGLFLIFDTSMPFVCKAARIPSSSLGNRNKSPFPLLSYRAVLPTRWIYVSASSGASNCTTQSTEGKSRPLAAISVAKRTAWEVLVNFWYIVNLADCFCFPCSWRRDTPGCILQNVSNTKRTCLQLDMKTIVLDCRCVLMKLQRTSSFLSSSTRR